MCETASGRILQPSYPRCLVAPTPQDSIASEPASEMVDLPCKSTATLFILYVLHCGGRGMASTRAQNGPILGLYEQSDIEE